MTKARVTKATIAKATRDERAAAKLTQATHLKRTGDSYQNFALQLGMGTANALSASTYGFNPITRIRMLLDWIYRGSWLGGIAIDVPADDMTRAGIDIHTELPPEDVDKLQKALINMGVWISIADSIKWAGLYGGCIAVFCVDGQDVSTPLRVETVSKGRFKGLMVLDRWMVEPDLQHLVAEYGPDLGKPMFYRVTSDAPALHGKNIHYSRCMRLEGIRLPWWQRVMENLWGLSVIERLYDRMVAFDSATQGAAQLVYKSYIRTYKLDGLREAVGAGGPALNGVLAQVELMRSTQGVEGVTLLDGKDDFVAHGNVSFAGISDALIQFGQQISGALQIPMVRLFGQSPAGLNSTGESDLRTYYDGILQRQERDLRVPMSKILRMTAQSEGINLEEDFSFIFRPLWQLTEQQKSEVFNRDVQSIESLESSGLISEQVALKELRQLSRITGRGTNITDEDIERAASEPAPDVVDPESLLEGGEEGEGGELPQPAAGAKKSKLDPKDAKDPKEPKKTADKRARTRDADYPISFAGLPIVIETPRGSVRQGDGWSVKMPADYGYLRGTSSAEGSMEELDCFIGPNRDSRDAYIIDTCDPESGVFDEHKLLLGFRSSREALDCFRAAYDDNSGTPAHKRIAGVTHMSLDEARFKDWAYSHDKTKPLAQTPRLVVAR